jgi:hypothetical protein
MKRTQLTPPNHKDIVLLAQEDPTVSYLMDLWMSGRLHSYESFLQHALVYIALEKQSLIENQATEETKG